MEKGIQGEVDGAGRISQIPKVRLRDSRSIQLQMGQTDSPWILHRMEKKACLTGRCRQVLWRERALGPA